MFNTQGYTDGQMYVVEKMQLALKDLATAKLHIDAAKNLFLVQSLGISSDKR